MLDTDEHVIHLHWDLPVSVLKTKHAVTLSHNVVSSTPRHEQSSNTQL
jgi:hypothetical protein